MSKISCIDLLLVLFYPCREILTLQPHRLN